ncbi:DNA repair protein complementing XP-C cells isoform X1 [Callorhinchus milii]|uniref:DNA repair protein complementing XP-C cells isoform X1 n=1 Tax=Callorhinchus milii TaxID=7868 RepID=UPI001C3FE2EA|nr:DNA repair protein complementing XP-C cells isoform X1 [Callorhinchus milii]
MVKRKGSSEAPAPAPRQAGESKGGPAKAKRARSSRGDGATSAKRRASADVDSDDFEPEKPLLRKKRSKVHKRAVQQDCSQIPQVNNTQRKKQPAPKGKGRKVTIKEEDENNDSKFRLAIHTRSSKRLKKKEEKGLDEPKVKQEEDDTTEDSEVEWEDVEELHNRISEDASALTFPEPSLPTKSVEIEIEIPGQAKKRRRSENRKAEFEMYLRRMIKRFNTQVRTDTHKVHLLCLLANGIFRNQICNKSELHALGMSLVPADFANVTAHYLDIPCVSNLLKWFLSSFMIDPSPKDNESNLSSALEKRMASGSARNKEELVYLFLIILRSLKLVCRLVLSLQPIPYKESLEKSKKPSRRRESKKSISTNRSKSRAGTGTTKSQVRQEKTQPCDNEGKSQEILRREKTQGFEHGDNEISRRPKNARRRSVASKVFYKEDTEEETNSDSDFEAESSDDCSNYSDESSSGNFRGKRNSSKAKSSKEKKQILWETSAAGGVTKGKKVLENSETMQERRNSGTKTSSKFSKLLTDCDGESATVEDKISSLPKGSDQWIEVYVEKEKKWVSVDCVHNFVNRPELFVKYVTKPLWYIVAFDNDCCVKDVTQRYDPAWMTYTRKQRVDPGWWDETLELYKSDCIEREKEEDLELKSKLLDQPLPTSVAEYKNHPLYVLKRHLLKYEIIHPSTAAILGYWRSEAVYSRDCVHTLHSKNTWLKEARAVTNGEVPCKMVKSLSNFARRVRLASAENKDKDDLGLFGYWQTEEYQPPIAIDGKVPRNEFGNVNLFKPCMLPIGCSHLRVPNLSRVARKLNIDCVPAVTGFDTHSGCSHAVVDGYVVCEEYKEVLLDAWHSEQIEIEKKAREKREKRVITNWKLLVKGLLIRERLKQRYSTENNTSSSLSQETGRGFSSDEEGPASQTPVTDASHSWPLNRQNAKEQPEKMNRKTKRQKKGEEKHLFPFEK